MTENTPNLEQEPTQSATDEYLVKLSPELWEELSDTSDRSLYARWRQLVQKHLSDYEADGSQDASFSYEELEITMLNHFFSKKMRSLDKNLEMNGLFVNINESLEGVEKFTLENLINTIQTEAEQHIKNSNRPFNILICGFPISGKSTVRCLIAKELNERMNDRVIIQTDKDYQKIPTIHHGNQINIQITEDVHSLDKTQDESNLDILKDNYDFLIEIVPQDQHHDIYLSNRGKGWLAMGRPDCTAPNEQFLNSDPREIKRQVANKLDSMKDESKKWFGEQVDTMTKLSARGMKAAILDPSEIIYKLYGLGSIDLNESK